jgi:hypothetical protein
MGNSEATIEEESYVEMLASSTAAIMLKENPILKNS